MKRFAGLLVAVLAFAGVTSAQQGVTEKIPVNNVIAAEVVKKLKADGSVPPAIRQISPNDKDNSVTVQGSPAAVTQVKEALRKLDVRPRQIQVNLRRVRVQVSPDGKRTEEDTPGPVMTTTNDVPATMTLTYAANPGGAVVDGWTYGVLPHVESDGSVTLSVTLRREGPHALSATATRRVPAGQTVRITGITDSQDKRVQELVRQGLVPEKSGAFRADYLEATPTEVVNGHRSTPQTFTLGTGETKRPETRPHSP